MSLKGTFSLTDAGLFFVHTSNDWTEPQRLTLGWKVLEHWKALSFFADRDRAYFAFDNRPACLQHDVVTFDDGTMPAWRFACPDRPAESVSRTPIPCPKVRSGIETRYRHGAWEKLLKTGWVLA